MSNALKFWVKNGECNPPVEEICDVEEEKKGDVGDASSGGEKQVDALPREVIAVSMEGGDFLLLRLLGWGERVGLASMVVSKVAGNTVSGELDAGSSDGEVGVLLS